jgi:chromosome partitioning protein
LVPVLPSDIDIHAAAKCITNLLLVAKIPREEQRIGVIANRVKKNTVMYRSLMRFLGTLEIPIVTTLRDSQNYVRASESGVGVFEMKPYLVREDLDQWLPLIGWLSQKGGAPATMPPPVEAIKAPEITTPEMPTAIPMPRQPLYVSAKSSAAPPVEREPEKSAEAGMKTSLPDFLKFVSRDS